MIFVILVFCGIYVVMLVVLLKVNLSGCWINLYEYVLLLFVLNLSFIGLLNLVLIWELLLICGILFFKKEGFIKSIKVYYYWKKMNF